MELIRKHWKKKQHLILKLLITRPARKHCLDSSSSGMQDIKSDIYSCDILTRIEGHFTYQNLPLCSQYVGLS
jgi:hypothetical protein